jgi:hypothetical protein
MSIMFMYYYMWQNKKLNFVALILKLSSKLFLIQVFFRTPNHPDPTPALAFLLLLNSPSKYSALASHEARFSTFHLQDAVLLLRRVMQGRFGNR